MRYLVQINNDRVQDLGLTYLILHLHSTYVYIIIISTQIMTLFFIIGPFFNMFYFLFLLD